MSDFNPYAVTPQGFGSDVWKGEWQEFLRVRQELVDEGMRRLGLATQLSFTTGTSPQQAFQTLRYIPSPREQRLMERQARVDDREHQRLLGAADFYGIEGAERMDPQELLQVVEARREIVAKLDEDNLGASPYETFWNVMSEGFMEALQTIGLGSAEGAVSATQHVPFIGDGIRKSAAVQRFHRAIANLEEGYLADNVDNERAAYEQFARPLSHFLGYSAMIGVTAEGVAATGFAGGIANPIIRASMQAGAVGTILEGGSDQPLQNIALFAALGGGGTAAGLGLAKLWTRLQGSFPRAFDRWRGIHEAEMRPGYDPGTIEAEILGGEGRAVVPWTAPGGAPMGVPMPMIGPGPRGALPPGPGGAVVGPGVYEMPGVPPRALPAPSGAPGTFVAPAGTTQFPRGQARPLTMEEAAADAVALTKQGTVLESPALPQFSRQPILDDADVALAAIATNPGQVSVIQNVGDVGKTVRRFLQEFLPNGVGPQEFRVVTRRIPRAAELTAHQPESARIITPNTIPGEEPWRMTYVRNFESERPSVISHAPYPTFEAALEDTKALGGQLRQIIEDVRTDVLVSDGAPITNQMVRDYETFGMFRGQKATTAGGQEVTVVELGAEVSRVRAVGSTGEEMVPTRSLLPGRTSAVSPVAPEAYVEMKAYALSRMAYESTASALQPFDWFSEELASQLPRYIEEFLDMRGVEGLGLRGTYTSLFTELRTAEFKTLAPEEFAQAEALAREAAQLEARRVMEGRPLWLGEVAETKGMEWVRTPNGLGGELRDRLTGEVIPLASEEAAFAFLRDFNRTPPDYSPATVVPAELFSAGPGTANPGAIAAPDFQGSLVELVEQGSRELDELEAMIGGGGTGGIPPGGGPPLLPGGAGSPGWQFGQLRQNRYQRYQQLEIRFSNLIHRWIEPMRGYAARATEAMRDAGLDVNYWDDIVGVQNSTAVAQNEMHAWASGLSSLLSQIRSVRVRNGTVTVIQELPEDQALAAMANAGYTEREVAAQLGLKRLIERMGDEYGVRHIIDYMPHLRAADSPEVAAQMLLRHDFTGPGRWFAEMVRQGGVEYREMNAEVLLSKWIRGAAYSRHVAPHVDRVNATWIQDENIPINLREITSRWLSLVVTGYVPGGIQIAPGVASVFNSVGVPINAREIAGIMRWANSNVYRAWLGGKPYAVLRELINPLLGWARIGNTADLTYTMQRFARDAAFRDEVKELGLRGGWIMRAPLASTAQEMFRAPDAALPGLARPENEFNAVQNIVREGVARVGDVAYDALGRLAPQGYSNTLLDPMRPIDKVNELGRMLSGYSAYRTMTRAIGEFRAALAENPYQELRPLQARLLRDSGAANLHESLQRAVIERVVAGADEDAAFSFANEVANQLARMGAADQPPMFQQFGEFGKWGSMFGNFSIQFRSNAWEGLRRSGLAPEFGGTSFDRTVAGTKFAARHALILGSLGVAAGYTGWNFSKWFWHGALGWGGGPFMWGILDSIRAYSARQKQANGEYLAPEEEAVLVETNAPPMWTALVNPYLGAMQTVEQAGRMMESSNPLENTASYLVTGSRESPAAVRQFGDPGALWPQGQPLFPGGGGASQ